jgi:hypothetical protein
MNKMATKLIIFSLGIASGLAVAPFMCKIGMRAKYDSRNEIISVKIGQYTSTKLFRYEDQFYTLERVKQLESERAQRQVESNLVERVGGK